jgi:hypothetical protein
MSAPGEVPAAEGDSRPRRHLGEESGILRTARALVGLVAVLVLYYAAPIGDLPSGSDLAVSVLGMLGGVVLLSWLIARQFRRLLGARPGEEAVRLDALVFLLYVIAPMFALGYVAVDDADPDQFVGLATKTDALYFTLSTLGTVGFGDVYADGQLARVLVMVQMAFDLVFVAALISLLGGQIRERATTRRNAVAAAGPGPDAAAGPGADPRTRQSPDPGAGAPRRPPGEGGTGR